MREIKALELLRKIHERPFYSNDQYGKYCLYCGAFEQYNVEWDETYYNHKDDCIHVSIGKLLDEENP
jgi:hypothetical protein